LADRTQARFFSPGSLPDTGRYPQPRAVAGRTSAGYVTGTAVKHLAVYQRVGDGLIWRLDERCLTDYAEALLPEAGAYARAAVELLFRGELIIEREGASVSVRARGVEPGQGTITIFVDDAAGERRLLERAAVRAGQAAEAVLATATLPSGARRVAAVLRGVDTHGEPIVVSTEHPLK
jgi:hypothetical protein